MPSRKVVDAGHVYRGWAQIAHALRMHVRTAQRYARPNAKPRLVVGYEAPGKPVVLAVTVEAFADARRRLAEGPEVVCEACGSDDVQVAAWVNPNTGAVADDFGTFNEEDTSFCCACERHGTLKRVR